MSKRRNFLRSVAIEIRHRATKDGVLRCEDCGCAVKRGEVHHTTADAMVLDKSRPLTAIDGVLLCCGPGSCHALYTAAQRPVIAKATRLEAAHLGERRQTKKIPSRGFGKKLRSHADRPPVPRRILSTYDPPNLDK